MKLFVLTSNIQPAVFIKAASESAARKVFVDGFLGKTISNIDRYVGHHSFQVRELTIELLIQLAPSQFKLDEDTGF